jgi:hypothetical protein
MRKFRSLVVAVAAMALMAGPVLADHTVTLKFALTSDVDKTAITSVTEGNNVDVIFQTNRSSGNAKLFQCLVWTLADGFGTEPMAVSVCGQPENLENAPAVDATAAWKEIKTADGTNATTHQISTTGLGGKTLGFAAQHPPLNHEEPSNALVFADLVVNPVGGNGDGHPGCKGVENAYDQVTTNNGAAKGNGKAAAALQAVADKLGCDLPE